VKSAMASRQKRGMNPEELNGRQKAAIVLMAMGPQVAAEITKNLAQAELEEISFEIARLDRVPSEIVTTVLSEWGQMETAAHSIAEGGVDYARKVLEQALGPQKAAAIVKRIEAQLRENAGFQNLRNADPAQVGGLLRGEHPQTIALLLAHLEPDQTAAILRETPTELGGEVLLRLARLEKVLPEVLLVLERCYGSESKVSISKDMTVAGGPEAVAAVLNRMTGTVEKELLSGIATRDPELCDAIKNLMFVFEDLVRLDDRALQRLLRDVQMKELALSLKAASDTLKERVIPLMSKRAADSLREEMEMLGPVRLRDVEAAQAEIVKLVRALEESGEIVIATSGDDLVV
jgi:flagellar motor switch protein FliG